MNLPDSLPRLAAVQADRASRPNPKGERRTRTVARRKRQRRKVVKAVRPELVARAKGRCERCRTWLGEFGGHAHHRRPRSLGGKFILSNLAYLCPSCHEQVQRKVRQ